MLATKSFRSSILFVLLMSTLSGWTAHATAQSPGVSPVLQLRAGVVNETAIYQNFTTILQHSSRIKSVLDFDEQVVGIEPVQGHPDRITVVAIATGVTTVTIIDEFDVATKVEILVKGDVRHLETILGQLFPDESITVTEVKGAVVLSGWVLRPERINQIIETAEQFYPVVLNHMRIGGVQQVSLKATVLEVNRSKLRQFGMNFGLTRTDSFLLSTPGPITPITGLAVTNTAAQATYSGFQNLAVSFGFMNPNQIWQGFIDALRTEGLLKIHATPVVTARNGSPAELLNGGEAPVIVPAGLGTTAIEFKPFGIILNAVPHLLGNGRIRLQVEPSVVERDFANSVVVDGITVPSFTVRKVSTEVEMNMGQTLVIGGLVSKRESFGGAKLPFFGELPWIGAAFSRKQYDESETELIVLVEPNYAAPLDSEQVPAGGPGKFTDAPTDVELIAHGLSEVPRVGDPCADAIWNCQECNANGFCSRHPNGRWSLGNTGAGCGQEGCATGAPDFIQPSLMAPTLGSAPQNLAPTVKEIPAISAENGMQKPVSMARPIGASEGITSGFSQANVPQTQQTSVQRPVRSGILPTTEPKPQRKLPNLLSPLLR